MNRRETVVLAAGEKVGGMKADVGVDFCNALEELIKNGFPINMVPDDVVAKLDALREKAKAFQVDADKLLDKLGTYGLEADW